MHPQFWAKVTGINSLTAATRQGTTRADPELPIHNGSNRKDSMMNLPGFFSESPPASHRRGSNVSNELTLMEMLNGGSPSKTDPELRRYATNDTLPPMQSFDTPPPMQKVVINDGAARETLRREHSNQERRYSSTPTSSALPSMQSSRSVGSFV